MLKERSLMSASFEALVIVTSILVAFAIDAAWDSAQERRAEREMVAAVLEEIRLNRTVLEEAEQFNDVYLDGIDGFFRATPDELRMITADSARAVLRALLIVPAFVPLNEAALNLTRSPSTTSAGVAARREVGRWLRESDRLVEHRLSLEMRAERVDERLTRHATPRRSEGLGFLPSMVMRAGPEALVNVWSDEVLATTLIEKGTAQTVFGLFIRNALPILDSVEVALASPQPR